MSWLKFWGKKSSKKRSELARSESFNNETGLPGETEKEKNARLRHTMSISRSGRFKQKNKQRSGILDKPEFFGNGEVQKENVDQASVQHPGTQYGNQGANYTSNSHGNKRTPPSTCREVSARQPITAHHFEGHQTVLWSYVCSFSYIPYLHVFWNLLQAYYHVFRWSCLVHSFGIPAPGHGALIHVSSLRSLGPRFSEDILSLYQAANLSRSDVYIINVILKIDCSCSDYRGW